MDLEPQTRQAWQHQPRVRRPKPTGKDNEANNVYTTASATAPTAVTADYSIQPGGGGWGMVFQWQAFRDLGNNTIVYTNGSYVATQGGPTMCCAAPPRPTNR